MRVSVEGDRLGLQERKKLKAFRGICVGDTHAQGLYVHSEDEVLGARKLEVLEEVVGVGGVPDIVRGRSGGIVKTRQDLGLGLGVELETVTEAAVTSSVSEVTSAAEVAAAVWSEAAEEAK
eukprot:g35098.t1